jgi:hypothetical protein
MPTLLLTFAILLTAASLIAAVLLALGVIE